MPQKSLGRQRTGMVPSDANAVLTPFRGVGAVHFALCLHGFLRLRFAFKSILKLGAREG